NAEPRIVAARRAGRGHDSSGDRTHGRVARIIGGGTLGRGRRARYGLFAIHRPSRDGAARRTRSGRRRHGPGAEGPACDCGLSWGLTMLAVRALNQFFGGSHTLWDVDVSIPAGSRTCLIGRNGMGKTTLLKCIMGLLPTSAGAITFQGIDLL